MEDWKLEIRSWKNEVGSWELEVRSWKNEVGSWELEEGRPEMEVGSWEMEVGSWMLDAGSWMLCNSKPVISQQSAVGKHTVNQWPAVISTGGRDPKHKIHFQGDFPIGTPSELTAFAVSKRQRIGERLAVGSFEPGSQKSEVGRRKTEAGSWKMEVGSWEMGEGSWKT